jgi:hypothetical protein
VTVYAIECNNVDLGSARNRVSSTTFATRRKRRSVPGIMPNRSCFAASYSRYSSDQQNAKSIVQQQGPCRDRAEQDGVKLLRELEFSDEAVSGLKLHRNGLDRMMTAAQGGRFGTLYVFDLRTIIQRTSLLDSVGRASERDFRSTSPAASAVIQFRILCVRIHQIVLLNADTSNTHGLGTARRRLLLLCQLIPCDVWKSTH